jgi:D-3-phosphoglycerate dehydrogenase
LSFAVHRILIADPLDGSGLEVFRAAGAELHLLAADERPRLAELVGDFDALVVRSATKVTASLLAAGERLRVVGRAGIGVDNVDVKAATERGILVVNAPTANALSATEHTFALLLALARNVPAADASLRRGEWERKRFVGVELQGKTLGVIGFGRIGQRVAKRARAFEMAVVAYDPYLDAEAARRLDVELLALPELLARADAVTLHTPLTEQTRGLLGAGELAAMKPGALLVNCGRGGVVDEAALLAALDSGPLAGAALDVFAQEPPADFTLMRHPKVVATPHIGAQTREAQERIATETARMVLAALDGSLAVTAVNLPFAATGTRGEPYLALGEQLGRLAGALLGGGLAKIEVELWGIEKGLQRPVVVSALKGALSQALGGAINYVNAERVAAGRGVEPVQVVRGESTDYPHLVGVRVEGDAGSFELAGFLFGEREPRVALFDGFPLEFRPTGRLLVLRNRDVPGVVGQLGTILGEAGVNIADIHLARRDDPGEAVAVLRVEGEVAEATLEKIRALDAVRSARVVDLDGA